MNIRRILTRLRSKTLFSCLLIILAVGAGSSCESDFRKPHGADLLVYFEALSDDQMREITAMGSRFTEPGGTFSVSESMIGDRATLRLWLSDPAKFEASGKLEIMRNAIGKIKKPTEFKFQK